MRRKLAAAAGAWLVIYILGTAVAISRQLPYDHPLWGTGEPDRVVRDWLSGSGTALSGPLFMFIVMSVSVFLLSRSRPASTVGMVGITVIGLLTPIGVLGEAITWKAVTGGGSDAVPGLVNWGMFVVGMLVWAFGVAEIVRLRAEKVSVQASPSRTEHGSAVELEARWPRTEPSRAGVTFT